MKRLVIWLLPLLALSFLQCSPNYLPAKQPQNKQPSWVSGRPVDPAYYIGIGTASMQQPGYDAIAKKNALADLAAEIEVRISGESILRQMESGGAFEEDFQTFIKSEIENNIQDYELVDSYAGEGYYFIYYRLSKRAYQERKDRELNRAKRLAFESLEQGQQSMQRLQVDKALSHYVRGLETLSNFLAEDLSYDQESQRLFLGSELTSELEKTLHAIHYELDRQRIAARAFVPLYDSLRLRVSYREKAISDLPLVAEFTSGHGNLGTEPETDESGRAWVYLQQVMGDVQEAKASVHVDLSRYLVGEDPSTQILEKILEQRARSTGVGLVIDLEPVSIYLRTVEKVGDEAVDPELLNDMLRSTLGSLEIKWTTSDQEADIILDCRFTSAKSNYNERHDVYTVFLNAHFTATDRLTATTLFSRNFNGIRGIELKSYLNAHKRAREEAITQFRQWLWKEIFRS